MTAVLADASWHERRLARRLQARGEAGQVEALLGLKRVIVGGRHRIESLYAVGGEGAVYLTRDLREPAAPPRVAKVALLPVHRPFRLDARAIRTQRDGIRLEATYLKGSGSRLMPRYDGLFEFQNPLLDRSRWRFWCGFVHAGDRAPGRGRRRCTSHPAADCRPSGPGTRCR